MHERKKIIVFILTVFILTIFENDRLNAQNICDTSNLFQYGSPVLLSEDNLRNFFKNFPEYIDNVNDILLISYKCIDVIKTKKQIQRFVKNNFKAPIWNVVSGYGEEYSYIRLMIDESVDKKQLQKKVNRNIYEFVKIGFEVYAVNFIYELVEYVYYIFINPDDKNVVTYGNVFGFNIPVKHFDYHNRLK